MLFRLVHKSARENAKRAIDNAPDGWIVKLSEPTRNLDQNARFWATLNDISQQVEWYGRKLAPEEWKHIFSSALKKQDVVPNLDGTGFVVLGQSTSKMSKREFADLITLAQSFGDERGVKWSEPVREDDG